MSRTPRLALGGWVLVLAVTIGVLGLAGRNGLGGPPLARPEEWAAWLTARGPILAAFAILRLLALGVAWYVLAVTVLGAAFRAVSARRLVAAIDKLTIPVLRRVLMTTAGVTLASGVPAPLALAAAPPVPVVAASSVDLAAAASQPAPPTTTATTTTSTPTPSQDGQPRPPPTLTMRLLPPGAGTTFPPADRGMADEPAAAQPDEAVPKVAATMWTVQPGDCFWSIADDVLSETWGRPPSDAEIVPYWQTLIEENRSVLADGTNPDLIFPGQLFTLPAPPAVP